MQIHCITSMHPSHSSTDYDADALKLDKSYCSQSACSIRLPWIFNTRLLPYPSHYTLRSLYPPINASMLLTDWHDLITTYPHIVIWPHNACDWPVALIIVLTLSQELGSNKISLAPTYQQIPAAWISPRKKWVPWNRHYVMCNQIKVIYSTVMFNSHCLNWLKHTQCCLTDRPPLIERWRPISPSNSANGPLQSNCQILSIQDWRSTTALQKNQQMLQNQLG